MLQPQVLGLESSSTYRKPKGLEVKDRLPALPKGLVLEVISSVGGSYFCAYLP